LLYSGSHQRRRSASGHDRPSTMIQQLHMIVRTDGTSNSFRVLESGRPSRTKEILESAVLSRKDSVLEHPRSFLEDTRDSRRQLGKLGLSEVIRRLYSLINGGKSREQTTVYKERSQNASRDVRFLDSRKGSRILERECSRRAILQLIQMKRGLSL